MSHDWSTAGMPAHLQPGREGVQGKREVGRRAMSTARERGGSRKEGGGALSNVHSQGERGFNERGRWDVGQCPQPERERGFEERGRWDVGQGPQPGREGVRGKREVGHWAMSTARERGGSRKREVGRWAGGEGGQVGRE
eukprot:364602-Chlamydomonas_euryale.AAC.19